MEIRLTRKEAEMLLAALSGYLWDNTIEEAKEHWPFGGGKTLQRNNFIRTLYLRLLKKLDHYIDPIEALRLGIPPGVSEIKDALSHNHSDVRWIAEQMDNFRKCSDKNLQAHFQKDYLVYFKRAWKKKLAERGAG